MALAVAVNRTEIAWRRDGLLKKWWQLTNSRSDFCAAPAAADAAVATRWGAP